VQDKWSSLVIGARINIKAIENKEQDLSSIFNYLDKDLSYNALAKLRVLKINNHPILAFTIFIGTVGGLLGGLYGLALLNKWIYCGFKFVENEKS
jgi:hypothetical protein